MPEPFNPDVHENLVLLGFVYKRSPRSEVPTWDGYVAEEPELDIYHSILLDMEIFLAPDGTVYLVDDVPTDPMGDMMGRNE